MYVDWIAPSATGCGRAVTSSAWHIQIRCVSLKRDSLQIMEIENAASPSMVVLPFFVLRTFTFSTYRDTGTAGLLEIDGFCIPFRVAV
jgi:hypothetical protein